MFIKPQPAPTEDRLVAVGCTLFTGLTIKKTYSETSVLNGDAGNPSLLKRFTSGTFAQP
jgi:hypothetical protein